MNWTRLGRDADHPAGIARYLVRDDTLYVWCDGTRNTQEWRWNFMTRKLVVGEMGARINWADWEQSLDVWCAMSRALDGVERFKTVRIGGYSRGYAIALGLAWLFATVTFAKNITVIGWAGKRVGNRAFHEQLDAWGVVHVNLSLRYDIVPCLPPWYARGFQNWERTRYWPVKAHVESGKDAALWRYAVATTEES